MIDARMLMKMSAAAATLAVTMALPTLSGAKGVTRLTAEDYIEIKQLSAKYAFAIEHCTNKGYDYADLYVPDGEFGVAPDWGQSPARTTKGRDALANADGGGPDGCRDPKTFIGYGLSHLLADLVITPTETGATSREILVVIGVGGNRTTIERQGGYESTYVKTPDGWRYKTRWHVFPDMATSVQFGPGSEYYRRKNGGAPAATDNNAPANAPASSTAPAPAPKP